ncbi:hypothetical protein BGZ65_001577 [Modicella reniformis]|uniref:PWWP domain-containing protein n=1 Tax=Modicella reniformis TaxID=1440133 RepID=A0A9P6MBN1_9FUNG|nr:hypothetical protein BGZ65_001577 [Modicella reniformis]
MDDVATVNGGTRLKGEKRVNQVTVLLSDSEASERADVEIPALIDTSEYGSSPPMEVSSKRSDYEKDSGSRDLKSIDVDDSEKDYEADKDIGEWPPEGDDNDDSDVPMEDVGDIPGEMPPRKRQKRKSVARDNPTDGATATNTATSTRRLRSTEAAAATPVPSSVGPRRGSSAGQRYIDIAAKRRRSESSEGSSKRLKSDRNGGPHLYGSLVWAKMEGFPWFPAELMDPKGSQIPAQVLEMKRDGQELHLVQFFDLQERGDRGRSWYWLTTSQMSPLGVDLDEDRKRVHIKAGWNPKRRKSVKQAYVDACGLKGIDPDVVLIEIGCIRPNQP